MKKLVKKILKKNKKLFNLARNIYMMTIYKFILLPYKKRTQQERRVSWGEENPDKTFYVIRYRGEKLGLFTWLLCVIEHLIYIEGKGWIPVVDMSSKNLYLEDDEVGKVNGWERYFKQPAEYHLEDIKNSKNIVLSSLVPVENVSMQLYTQETVRHKYNEICKKYIRFSDEFEQMFEKTSKELLKDEETYLGVLCRGTDYWVLHPTNHPVQPTIEQIIPKVYECMRDFQCTKIYLCTEDKTIVKALKNEFCDKLVTYERNYVDYSDGMLADAEVEPDYTRKQQGFDYLMQVALLLKTKSLMAGKVGATQGILALGCQYEHKFLWELGVYPRE